MLCGVMSNSTHTHQDDHLHSTGASTSYTICRILVIILTVAGNFLLILSLFVRRGALNFLDRLMLNTVLCNLLLVLISIPTSLEIEISDSYPYGIVGCKLIYPVCTFLMNACVFTYVVIAFERWSVVSRMGSSPPSHAKGLLAFLTIYSVALLTVVPYAPVLDLHQYQGQVFMRTLISFPPCPDYKSIPDV